MVIVSAERTRDTVKSRHREAILDAARLLVSERGGPVFTVDELADRAGVARRTVFNHFATLDEILLTLCGEVLDVLVDEFIDTVTTAPVGDGTRESMFRELSESLRCGDLPTAITSIVSILGGYIADESRGQALNDRAFVRVSHRLLQEVCRRHPNADPFDAELLVGGLINGVAVSAKHWLQTGATPDAAGRASWNRLLTRLIDSMRSGYMLSP